MGNPATALFGDSEWFVIGEPDDLLIALLLDEFAEIDGSGLLDDYVGTNSGSNTGSDTSNSGSSDFNPAQDMRDIINQEKGLDPHAEYYSASEDIKKQVQEAYSKQAETNSSEDTTKTREEEVVNNDWFNDSGNVGDNFCSEPAVKNVLRLLGYFLLLLRLAVPLIIIAKGTFLFYNAVTKDSGDQLSKSAKEFGIKVAIGITIFFIPTLISAALGLYYDFAKVESEYRTCSTCLLKPGEC